MIRALAYLQVCTLVNALLCQLRRLRQPKYLVGALLGAAYMGSVFVLPWLNHQHRQPGRTIAVVAQDPGFDRGVSLIAPVAVILFLLAAWVAPRRRAALNFTETEALKLFSAPFARRSLLHFSLLKSQGRLLGTALMFSLFTVFLARSGQELWLQTVGWWVMVSILDLHQTGAALTLTWLTDRGVATPRRRLLSLAVLGLLALGLAAWSVVSTRTLTASGWVWADDLPGRAEQVIQNTPLRWTLAPGRLVCGPLLTREPAAFAWAMAAALLLFALHYRWVLQMQVSFEESTLERARERARLAAAVKSGQWHLATTRQKPAREPFRLNGTGAPYAAFWWKNLIAAQTTFPLRLTALLMLGLLAVFATVAVVSDPKRGLLALGGMSAMFLVMSFFSGPHLARTDLRQDLPLADVLKNLPVPGTQLFLGQLLAPATLLSATQLGLGLLAAVGLSFPHAAVADRVGAWLAFAIVVLPLNLLNLAVINGLAMVFPAWMQTGSPHGQGIELMGRQMLIMLAQVVALAVSLLVPGGLAVLTAWGTHLLLPWGAALPLAAGVTALALVAEVYAAVRMLGDYYDRTDASQLHPQQ